MTARRFRAPHAALGATVTLALITALTAALLAVGIAPAASPPGAQDRAGAFFSAAPACAREVGAGSPCTLPGSTVSTARIAVGCCVAAKAGRGGADEAFHYTRSEVVDLIEKNGLRPGSYLTKSGDLSPLQAQIDPGTAS